MQKINQESNCPDLGQDKCKNPVEEGREHKYCKTWLVRGTTTVQGGTLQLLSWAQAAALEEEFAKGI